jgi:predicted metalloprotease
MASRRRLAPVVAVVAAVGIVAGCAARPGVTVERADVIAVDGAAPTTPDPSGTPTTTLPPADAVDPDPAAIDFGPGKPPQEYDDFLLRVLTDLEVWWAEQFPAVYGEPFEPLEGKVYAAYPGRPDDLPGCGAPSTTYDEVQQYVAFYCGVGDFILYDDGEDGLLAQLAAEYGPGTIGTVLAHEYGHAIQLRAGNLDRPLPTILTEQQADCFAGAWTGRAARGEATTLAYGDADVRAGLIAMTKVSDPLGIDQFVDGGHGSAFDRVGAFQVGFAEGPARCAELLDDPLPIVPNRFIGDDAVTGGDAPFGYGDGELLSFLPDDLNLYWDRELEVDVPGLDALTLVGVPDLDDVSCDDLRGDPDAGAAYCAGTGEVLLDEPRSLELYRSLGDFSVGYQLGRAWAEAVQQALGSDLQGEARSLVNDCLTGGWIRTVVPVDDGSGILTLPQPRLPDRTAVVSAGDLDEAIQTVLLVADAGVDDDVAGNAFEKIEALRTGVIEGTDVCLDQL